MLHVVFESDGLKPLPVCLVDQGLATPALGEGEEDGSILGRQMCRQSKRLSFWPAKEW
jgi:hypothetical protein